MTQCKRYIHNLKRSSMKEFVASKGEERKKLEESIFKVMPDENFPKLSKAINPRFERLYHPQLEHISHTCVHVHACTRTHIHTIKALRINMCTDFSSETMQDRR